MQPLVNAVQVSSWSCTPTCMPSEVTAGEAKAAARLQRDGTRYSSVSEHGVPDSRGVLCR